LRVIYRDEYSGKRGRVMKDIHNSSSDDSLIGSAALRVFSKERSLQSATSRGRKVYEDFLRDWIQEVFKCRI
jgi:hypothetical protein